MRPKRKFKFIHCDYAVLNSLQGFNDSINKISRRNNMVYSHIFRRIKVLAKHGYVIITPVLNRRVCTLSEKGHETLKLLVELEKKYDEVVSSED